MAQLGTVNYYIHEPDRQAFEIDEGGIVGKLVSSALTPIDVVVHDTKSGDAQVSFATDAVSFATFPSAVKDFAGNDWQETYDAELTDPLRRTLKAQEVVICDHTVRKDDPFSNRKPARTVHSDYSPEGAEKWVGGHPWITARRGLGQRSPCIHRPLAPSEHSGQLGPLGLCPSFNRTTGRLKADRHD